MQTFENIGIIGFCEDKSHNPDKQFLLFDMYLQLSCPPASEWKDYFAESRREARAQPWRRAWVEGDCLVVYCQPEELQQEIENLKHDIAAANRQYRQLQTLRGKRGRQLEQEEAQERVIIRQLAQQLRF
ncbi:hypothetical protein [Chromobacterium sp. IIBBL 290-4]|uniref:hypothetical protein n=1 Tax=Chromobacterium sp. IIBBL 290-4 TaxID=2953890 RepID=UPI0020B8DB40|nr:hypothetical protein [Chromobacterium sp. IIBBL 290-4]UTH73533.1 hypothetical protein NKT35_18630 [Chromobacterium sp. IIBBL 290-4]